MDLVVENIALELASSLLTTPDYHRSMAKFKRRKDMGKGFRSEFVPKEDTFEFRKKRSGVPRMKPEFRDGPLEKFKAVCSECGKDCELPFKPTNNKPVFCSDCFRKQDRPDDRGGRDRDRRGPSSAGPSSELNIINMKLDKIMKALKIE
jgi:CxxC-x17-CxxC domain-containing protein